MIYLFDTFGEFTEFAMEILNFVAIGLDIILLLFFSWFYFVYIGNSFRKQKKVKIVEPKNKFAILIPARNESKVIKNILDSMKKQDYPKNLYDIFVIVETLEDPTVQIVEQYGDNFHIIVRGDLEGRRTKGYALDDAYQYIKKNNLCFDAYMIFDADNIADQNYISVMNSIKEEGYQIGVGYRNYTNASKNWMSLTSGILFSFINAFTSKGRTTLFKKANLTGTGYFVDSKIVDDAGGWIWNGMTEDVELSYYANKTGIKMKYYSLVHYYDEQATNMKTLHTQHVRWVWGFFVNMKKKFKNYNFNYSPEEKKTTKFFRKMQETFGIYPFLAFIIMEIVIWLVDWILAFICIGIGVEEFYIIQNAFIYGAYHLFIAYIAFAVVALFTICIDNHNLKFTPLQCILGIFTYPFFFSDFLFAFLDGLFNKKKRTSWKVIEHKGEVIDKKAIKIKEGDQNE